MFGFIIHMPMKSHMGLFIFVAVFRRGSAVRGSQQTGDLAVLWSFYLILPGFMGYLREIGMIYGLFYTFDTLK